MRRSVQLMPLKPFASSCPVAVQSGSCRRRRIGGTDAAGPDQPVADERACFKAGNKRRRRAGQRAVRQSEARYRMLAGERQRRDPPLRSGVSTCASTSLPRFSQLGYEPPDSLQASSAIAFDLVHPTKTRLWMTKRQQAAVMRGEPVPPVSARLESAGRSGRMGLDRKHARPRSGAMNGWSDLQLHLGPSRHQSQHASGRAGGDRQRGPLPHDRQQHQRRAAALRRRPAHFQYVSPSVRASGATRQRTSSANGGRGVRPS